MKTWLVLTGMVAFLATGCGFTSTSPGEAVVFSRFGDVAMKCYPAGFYLYNPFTTSVYHVDVKVQKFEVKPDASSRDLQNVHTTIVVNFSIDGNKCHELIKNVGVGFAQQIILPAVEEVTKASTALFPVEKVIQERPKLKKEIEDGLKARLSPYWISRPLAAYSCRRTPRALTPRTIGDAMTYSIVMSLLLGLIGMVLWIEGGPHPRTWAAWLLLMVTVIASALPAQLCWLFC